MTYTMGSLFAGIGGFDLGFERAGFKTSWQVEIDPYCQKVLAKNFPEAERFGDIRECGIHNLKPVDIICGGFPCQDISNAGLRAGIEGERSGLWKEYARIIRELRPKFVVVENVAALLGRGMGVVLGDLAEIGYDAEWEIISAADVGAPHLRERVWLLAYPQRSEWRKGKSSGDERDRNHAGWPKASSESGVSGANGGAGNVAYPKSEQCERSRNTWDRRIRFADRSEELADASRSGRKEQHTATVAVAEGFDTGRADSIRRSEWWAVEPNVGRVAHGIPKRVDRLRGLGNAVVPQIPEMIARRIKQALESA